MGRRRRDCSNEFRASLDRLRGADRLTYRNGYREREWDTRVGTIELDIPKIRTGSYFPSLLEPRRRHERALLSVVQQAYIHGLSTRDVDALAEALGLKGISKDQVSRFCKELGRPGPRLPDPVPRRQIALPDAGRHVREGAREQARDLGWRY